MKIKICGLSRLADIECVNKLQPDFIGFVFYAIGFGKISGRLFSA